MSTCQGVSKNKTFIASFPFGLYSEKLLFISTRNDKVYLHIKERANSKYVSLTRYDFYNILRLKDKICSHLNEGAKVAAALCNSDNYESTDSEQDVIEIANKLSDDNKNNVSAKSMNNINSLNIKVNHKKHKKPKRSIDECYSVSDDEKTSHKRNKKARYNCSNDDSKEVTDVEQKPKHGEKNVINIDIHI